MEFSKNMNMVKIKETVKARMDRAHWKAMVIHEDEDEFVHDPHHQSIQLKPWWPFRTMWEWRGVTKMMMAG